MIPCLLDSSIDHTVPYGRMVQYGGLRSMQKPPMPKREQVLREFALAAKVVRNLPEREKIESFDGGLMIGLVQGDLLAADAEALVNAVNCVGIMGKGLALQFKQAYPDNFKEYERACRAGEVKPGSMLIVATNRIINPKYIINFPTKRHWKDQSRIEDIKSGLESLVENTKALGMASLAIPPLGCGLGGLNWFDVKPLIEEAFSTLPAVNVLLYEPH